MKKKLKGINNNITKGLEVTLMRGGRGGGAGIDKKLELSLPTFLYLI